MNKAAISIIVLVVGCLTGCQVSMLAAESGYFAVPEGSTVTLNQALRIPPNGLKIYIQDGQLGMGPNEYDPFCKFELREVKPEAQLVQPGKFEIHMTRRASGIMAGIPRSTRLAGLGTFSMNQGLPSPILYSIQFFLRSTTQPEVYKLSCGHLQDPGLTAQFLSLQEIDQALGEVITLQLAAAR
ncbi:MAG: hypothetical protein H6970_01260 [Gammaproteobacteria bacterium]|nr:hypothetical protein [Gammaproteobacteria bacterium]MCP5423686.1 hypothetical protein [Gammaproteobacteria bacterium]